MVRGFFVCDIQGRLFELSADKKIASASFIKTFMTSETAKALDSTYNCMQWAEEEYLLEDEGWEESVIEERFEPDRTVLSLSFVITSDKSK